MELKHRMKRKAEKYKRKFETSDPFKIAKELGILVQIGDLGSRYGCYMYLKKHKCIFINEKLDYHTMKFVMAHELGHAIMHPKQDCYFVRNRKFMEDVMEKEANMFAVQLLLGHEDLDKYASYTMQELENRFGYSEMICKIRWEIF